MTSRRLRPTLAPTTWCVMGDDAYPSWFTVRPATGALSFELSRRLFQNAVVIPSPVTDRLGGACREANITAVVGVCEKRPQTTGTMFNTQLFIGPDGSILGKHQKHVPTLAERVVHTGGDAAKLEAFKAPFGTVSGGVCAENANPPASYALMTKYPVVHVAAWPAFLSPALARPAGLGFRIASQGLMAVRRN